MDELEKKRRLQADPKLQKAQPGEQENTLMNEQQQSQLLQQKAFERQLNKALNISVPMEIADKVILKKQLRTHRNLYSMFAIAASFVVVSIFTIHLLNRPHLSIPAEALAHVYHEIDKLTVGKEIPQEKVQQQLAKLDISVSGLPSKITYASRCGFGKEVVMHLIAEVNGQPVTILLTPFSILKEEHFADQKFSGKISRLNNHGVIVIAQDRNLIGEISSRIIGA